jgi:ABC-2 type transport system permease protein
MLAIPVLVPATLSAYAVVGERVQGTLEPILTTPVRRKELLLGKALAVFIPSVTVAYAVFAIFVALVELFARPPVASALIQGRGLLAQVLFTPPLAAWSIWIGIAISARSRDPRNAAQIAILASLPTVAITTLIAFNIIPATFPTAVGLGAALLALVRLGWHVATAIFDRERLITSTK